VNKPTILITLTWAENGEIVHKTIETQKVLVGHDPQRDLLTIEFFGKEGDTIVQMGLMETVSLIIGLLESSVYIETKIREYLG